MQETQIHSLVGIFNFQPKFPESLENGHVIY